MCKFADVDQIWIKYKFFPVYILQTFLQNKKMQFVDTNLTDKNPVDACHNRPVHVLDKTIFIPTLDK